MIQKLELGRFKIKKAILKALKDFEVTNWAKELIDKMPLAKKETIELKVMSVKELGFPNGATLQEIYAKAKTLGLDLCPAEVGVALRIAYLDQPLGEWLLVAMEPITSSGGGLRVFCVVRLGGGLWLRAICSHPDSVWFSGDCFVFRKSSKLPELLEPLNLDLRLKNLEEWREKVEEGLKKIV